MYEAGFKFYLTGSNAKLLSSEISTSLTGRNKVLPLYPFSFKEYLRFKNKAYQTERLSTKNRHLLIRDLNAYLESGGFPLIVKENDTELLNGFFQDILYRDIISRYQLTQVGEIRQIALYFASNSGKTFSYATLQEMAGIKSSSSVKRYVDLYEQTYLFFYLKRYDVSLRKQLRHPKKVYAADTAIIHRLGFRFSEDKGRILENLVFLELLRRGHELYYYSGKKECDFLIKKGIHIQSAIQVCWSLNVENQEREKEGLLEAMQAYKLKEGLLITMDSSNFKSPNPSINVIPVWEWLLTVDR
jgi:predicted AAA+ superfamily ATPase